LTIIGVTVLTVAPLLLIGVRPSAMMPDDAPNTDDVEYATLEWVAWFNTTRLLEPLGYVTPAEYETAYYATLASEYADAGLK
jgi:hypothetical protein